MARLAVVVAWFFAALSGWAQGRVVAVTVDGVIHPITVEILTHAIHQAAAERAEMVLLRIDTPGGLMDASSACVQKIIASPVPVVVFVTPSGGRAASAGFFLMEAGDVAAMASGTNTGAASPVLLGGQMDAVMRKKVENDAAASLRSITSRRGRNTELAEKAVFEARSFSDQEALKERLIDLVVTNENELLAKLDGREVERFDGSRHKLRLGGVQVVEYQPTIRERLIGAVADPNVAFILLMLGILGIYVEFNAPGLIVPGVLGGIALLLGVTGLAVLPINWVGVALLVLAVGFFILEAKFTSHGILGVGGALAMVLGAILLVDGPPAMRIQLSTALGLAIPMTGIALFLTSLVLRTRRDKVVTGTTGMLNLVGTALTELTPGGTVQVHGEYWTAISNAPVAPGARVRVVSIDGLTLRVEPIP